MCLLNFDSQPSSHVEIWATKKQHKKNNYYTREQPKKRKKKKFERVDSWTLRKKNL